MNSRPQNLNLVHSYDFDCLDEDIPESELIIYPVDTCRDSDDDTL